MKQLISFTVLTLFLYSCSGGGNANDEPPVEDTTAQPDPIVEKAPCIEIGNWTDWPAGLPVQDVEAYLQQNMNDNCFVGIFESMDMNTATRVKDCNAGYNVRECELPDDYPFQKYEDILFLNTNGTPELEDDQYELWAFLQGKYDISTIDVERCMDGTCFWGEGGKKGYDLSFKIDENPDATTDMIVISVAIPRSEIDANKIKTWLFRFESEKKRRKKLFIGSRPKRNP